jgi:mannan endo-1,4-beta-mannosidase
MIRRLHDYAKIKPNLGVCIGEYNFYGEQDIAGAIALAEVLGTFARESVACAAYWTFPPEGSPTAAAFRLLRNYDGQGGALGSWLIPNNIETTDDSSVLTTYDKDTGTAKFLVLNKTIGTAKTFTFDGLALSSQSKVTQYSITQTSPNQVTSTALPTNERVSIEAPPLSAHVIVITGLKL